MSNTKCQVNIEYLQYIEQINFTIEQINDIDLNYQYLIFDIKYLI